MRKNYPHNQVFCKGILCCVFKNAQILKNEERLCKQKNSMKYDNKYCHGCLTNAST